MRPEDLDKRTLFALQIDKLMSEKNKTEDPQQIQLMQHRLSQLKEYVFNIWALLNSNLFNY